TCDELRSVARKLGNGEGPFADALDALVRLATGMAGADKALARACAALRAVDDKSFLAYALNAPATLHLAAGRTDAARACASEALRTAGIMQRVCEEAIARATLLQIAVQRQQDAAVGEIEALLQASQHPDRSGARVRSAVHAAARLADATAS